MVDAPATLHPPRWSDWPARHRPVRSAVAAMVIGLVALAVAIVDPWLAVVAVAVLVWATSEALLPVSYAVDDEGITVVRGFVPRRHPWSRFERARPHRDGVVLVGRGHRRALREGRTLLVRCADDREGLAQALTARLKARS